MKNEKLKVALIGGAGAFIAEAHQRAIHANSTAQITCGVLSRSPAKGLEAASAWPYPITPYGSIAELIQAGRDDGRLAVDYAVIVTPNNVHAEQALRFITEGIPVFLEKPVTFDLAEAQTLARLAQDRNVPVGVAHTYVGHWTTKLARHIVTSGKIGEVRRVDATYYQGWLADALETMPDAGGYQQAWWRTNPETAGASCCGGDIGTHALMQLRYVTGLEVKTVKFADVRAIVRGRKLDDNFTTFCELSNGAVAIVAATQVAIGHKNGLRIEVNGSEGTIIWEQEKPEELHLFTRGGQHLVYYRGAVAAKGDPFIGDLPSSLASSGFLPGGHPEGFHDAFSRLYQSFQRHVRAWKDDPASNPVSFDVAACGYPTLHDGVAGMRFIEVALRAHRDGKPVDFGGIVW